MLLLSVLDILISFILQGPDYDLRPSATLKSTAKQSYCRDWLKSNAESAALLSGLLRVIHPEMFVMARQAMVKLADMEEGDDLINLWTSLFNGCQVMSNRETPIHRDNNSSCEWYDILCSVGPYPGADLELTNVGLTFQYNTGVIFALCGRLLRHGVSATEGDRMCLAYYMRENVQRRLGSNPAGWSYRQEL
jgi:hypothetical protein